MNIRWYRQPLYVSTALLLAAAHPALAYPEFQQFSEKHSGRTTDCSMCHVNPNGPVGQDIGQLGSLKPADLERLTKEHMAMDPGVPVDSPVLNEFGNKIITLLGRKKFLEIKEHPEQLAPALGTTSDLDGDGIPDSQEFLDGTDPLNKYHGDPWKLFLINLNRYKVHVILAVVSILLLNYGFMQLLNGFAALAKARQERSPE
jgi:hypothetical protein